jgi:hypothetical protein
VQHTHRIAVFETVKRIAIDPAVIPITRKRSNLMDDASKKIARMKQTVPLKAR